MTGFSRRGKGWCVSGHDWVISLSQRKNHPHGSGILGTVHFSGGKIMSIARPLDDEIYAQNHQRYRIRGGVPHERLSNGQSDALSQRFRMAVEFESARLIRPMPATLRDFATLDETLEQLDKARSGRGDHNSSTFFHSSPAIHCGSLPCSNCTGMPIFTRMAHGLANLFPARFNSNNPSMRIGTTGIRRLFELKRAGKRFARPCAIRVKIGMPVQFEQGSDPQWIDGELWKKVEEL